MANLVSQNIYITSRDSTFLYQICMSISEVYQPKDLKVWVVLRQLRNHFGGGGEGDFEFCTGQI